MNVLALDCGSSSLKFRIFARDPVVLPAGRRRLARGLVERIGDDNSRARLAVEVFRHRPRKYSACTWRFQVVEPTRSCSAAASASTPPRCAPASRAGMEWCGLVLEAERNAAAVGRGSIA